MNHDDLGNYSHTYVKQLRADLAAMTADREHWMDSYNHYELTKQLVAAQARD